MSTLELLIGTLIENPAALPRGTPLMKRMCSRCDLVLGWKICAPDQAGTVTHGYCEECATITRYEFDAWLRANSQPPAFRPSTRA